MAFVELFSSLYRQSLLIHPDGLGGSQIRAIRNEYRRRRFYHAAPYRPAMVRVRLYAAKC